MPYNFDPLGYSAASSSPSERKIFSVSDLNRQAKRLLEVSFPSVWIEGELSNIARPRSGHWYFTLKDAGAQVRCAMFRGSNIRVRFQPAEGQQVLIRAKVSLYEGRGDYQLIAEHMEEAGAGALQRAFEELKARLAREGLFAPELKKSLPSMPSHIAVVTSPTGAAIQDILTVFKRRFPPLGITVVPTAVQGSEAASQIVNALSRMAELPDIDAVIVSRGGGSMEDLWPFNEESVARAIAACPVPVISAVGHEVDFTIADFVADYRAPTPSAAAEVLSPDQQELLGTLASHQNLLAQYIRNHLFRQNQHLIHLHNRLRHPGEKLREQSQRLDDLDIRLRHSAQSYLQHKQASLIQNRERLYQYSPSNTLQRMRTLQQQLEQRLTQSMAGNLSSLRQQLASKAGQLHAFSPLATLERGFAIVQNEDGQVITDSQQARPGDRICTRLARGELLCTVEEAAIPE